MFEIEHSRDFSAKRLTGWAKLGFWEGVIHLEKFRNTLLQHFDESIIERLALQPVTFETWHQIEYPGRPIEHLYFVEEGMASMTTTFKDGSQVEVGMFGCASVIGIPALMGTKLSLVPRLHPDRRLRLLLSD